MAADFVPDERRSKTFLRKSGSGGEPAGPGPVVHPVRTEQMPQLQQGDGKLMLSKSSQGSRETL